MKYKMKLWVGVGAAALMQASWVDKTFAASPERPITVAAPGGEGGEGGEAGIDPQAARTDAVVYLTALDVIRAHYFAGQLAYAAGNKPGAQELFVHPISEVYVDFKPVLEERGGNDFEQIMSQAGVLAGEGKPTAQVATAAKQVLAAVDRAEAFAPPADDNVRLQARVLAEFLGRAAQQYTVALKSDEEEPYLDGLGLYMVAKQRSDRNLKAISVRSPEAAKRVTAALAALAKVYPGAKSPKMKQPLPYLLATVSSAQLALSGI